jgi:hypothetical protein
MHRSRFERGRDDPLDRRRQRCRSERLPVALPCRRSTAAVASPARSVGRHGRLTALICSGAR